MRNWLFGTSQQVAGSLIAAFIVFLLATGGSILGFLPFSYNFVVFGFAAAVICLVSGLIIAGLMRGHVELTTPVQANQSNNWFSTVALEVRPRRFGIKPPDMADCLVHVSLRDQVTGISEGCLLSVSSTVPNRGYDDDPFVLSADDLPRSIFFINYREGVPEVAGRMPLVKGHSYSARVAVNRRRYELVTAAYTIAVDDQNQVTVQ